LIIIYYGIQNHIQFNTSQADYTQMPDYPEKHDSRPLPAPYLKNKSGGGKGPLGKSDFCSKTRKLVKHLQTMQVTPGCDPGIYGPDKDGVDWAFGSFTEAAVNVRLIIWDSLPRLLCTFIHAP
jgi:hypothetical protein